MMKSLQSKEHETEEIKDVMEYLQRWKVDAPRKRSLRQMKKTGMHVLTTDALFEEAGGEDIIDCLENTGIFADYFLNEIFGKEEPVETIRKMNPGVKIPSGAELAAELSKESARRDNSITVKEKLKETLTGKGMSDTQADLVLKKAIPEIGKLTPNYSIRWDDPEERYPENMYITWWLTLKEIALEWIDENKPKAFFRDAFI